MGEKAFAISNLDIRCAELGRELAQMQNMKEKTLNAALAVLEEQGPYAMFLCIKARERDVADQLTAKCAKFLQDVFPKFKDLQNIFNILKSLAEDEDLDDLLFARELLRNALAYAQYHLKAREGAG